VDGRIFMGDRSLGSWTRRKFVGGLVGGGAVSLLGGVATAAEPPPETTRIRLTNRPVLCEAPQYVAEELLQGEGFTDIKYPKKSDMEAEDAFASGDVDIAMAYVVPMIPRIDAGHPIVVLAGVHVGCIEIFASERIRSLRELKGKRFALEDPEDRTHIYGFMAIILGQIGLDVARDVTWIAREPTAWPQLLADGKIDAFLGIPPISQEARARKIGRVILNTLTDRPWSQYFCCMIVGHREFVRRNPIATKRAVRAILKASELCALQPERTARFLADKGYVERSDYGLQAMRELVYGRWRQYDPADALRFYALRLHEAGLIKSSPQKILAQGTDWRFVNGLKRELRG
jgi:NitT/TauT family transport system substrate-binding protein